MQQCCKHPVTPQEKTYNHLVVYFTRTTSVEETPREAAIFDRMFDRFLDGTASQKAVLYFVAVWCEVL
jgi:hypothetical protein